MRVILVNQKQRNILHNLKYGQLSLRRTVRACPKDVRLREGREGHRDTSNFKVETIRDE